MGTLYILIGLLGFGVLVRDRVRAVPVRMPLLILASVMSSLFIGYFSYHLMELNRKIDMYVMPRKVSEEQVATLKTFLTGHEARMRNDKSKFTRPRSNWLLGANLQCSSRYFMAGQTKYFSGRT